MSWIRTLMVLKIFLLYCSIPIFMIAVAWISDSFVTYMDRRSKEAARWSRLLRCNKKLPLNDPRRWD